MSLDMYAEIILDHYRDPKNFGKMENPDMKFRDLNPLCGDQYEFQVKLEKDIIKDIKFNGDGCAISMASSSMLSEFLKGKKVSDIDKISGEDIIKILGIKISPARRKCALLSLLIVKKFRK